ncbi:aromatic-ring-hydroxylating dioxygenase subunit beta [Geodermatophilus ruber]|uniref:3-phenylpropionate/cinnamic acid dioxygenase, small subunit n=1 Tax=Geodermatophilus ruber TaxID=504800 RepID=A0A1I4GLV2_9ACTN|nr:aromatic-ring-hydroxylating dioxygenase subunit beta [Geodermatophilus ruber]SFL31022.1 3-phenylpropionate/cinnamic acid dioxygenase, small subunit [Geodermatophilus ruber]
MTTSVNWELKREVEDFLYREAHILDEHRLEDWLDLFTEDAEYLVPLREYVQGDVAPAGHPVIKDDKQMLTVRVRKDATGYSHVETPVSMTCHLISNVVVDEGPEPDEVEVLSAFTVRQARKLRDEAWWAGRRRDRLRRVDGGWKIARREVHLDATVLPRGIAIFF